MTEHYEDVACPELLFEFEFHAEDATLRCIAYVENEHGRDNKFKFRVTPERVFDLMKQAVRWGMNW